MTTELEALTASPGTLTLVSGFPVRVERIKTRQLLKLMKIITNGSSGAFMNLDYEAERQVFTAQLLGLIIFAIPEAEDETIEFLQSVIAPAHLKSNPTKENRRFNEELWSELTSQLSNPEIEDTVSIITHVVQAEGPELLAMGKRIAAMLPFAAANQKTHSSSSSHIDASPPSESPASSESSPEPSTSSNGSTAGPKKRSSKPRLSA